MTKSLVQLKSRLFEAETVCLRYEMEVRARVGDEIESRGSDVDSKLSP